MPAGPTSGAPGGLDLQAELAAERAATDHWRRVARQRSADFAALRRRPLVRIVLAIERRIGPLRHPLTTATARVREVVERAVLAFAALGHRSTRLLVDLEATLRSLPAPALDDRRVLLIVVGAHGESRLSETTGARAVDVMFCDSISEVRRAVDACDHDLIGIVLPTSDPLDDTWLSRLAAGVREEVVAATPMLVHPRRPHDRATPHDGKVRSAGLAIGVASEGIPVVRSVGAGTVPDPRRPSHDVAAGSGACLLVDRAACQAAGGLPVGGDLDVVVVELCARLRSRGGRIVAIPSAVMVDHRPVRSRAEMGSPVDPSGPAWRAAIDRSGPVLRRSAHPGAEDPLRFVFTVSAPSAKVAARWGDWHLAEGLAASLRRIGHEVRVQTADRADDPAGRACDVHLVIRGLQPVRRSPGQLHLLWIISHPESIEDDELDAADLVLVASPRFGDHLRARTTTPVEVMLQATDHHRFAPQPVDLAHQHTVTVVAKTRDVARPVVADALSVGLRPAIYGAGWRDLVDPQLVVADHLDNAELPIVYSSAGVVLNDHWRTMQLWGFVSNRLFDVLACGTPVISDPVEGLTDLFDGGVLEYHSAAELRRLVDHVLEDPVSARIAAERGRTAILAEHTFDHRADQVVRAIAEFVKTA